MKTLVLTDNQQSLDLARDLAAVYGDIDIFQSPNSLLMNVPELKVKDWVSLITQDTNLFCQYTANRFFRLN